MNQSPPKVALAILAVIPVLIAALRAADPPTLASQLQEITSKFDAEAPSDLKLAYRKDIAAVVESGIAAKATAVGSKAPLFTLKNATGKEVALSALLKKGPVVLTWYRGAWCPYCNATLRAYQKSLGEITAAGGQLVALSPELPDKSLSTREKNELKFEILSDSGQKVARDYGLVFSVSPEVAESYRQIFDMREYNGADAAYDELPLAATFVIDRSGVVRWAFIDADYRKRAEPSAIVAALEELKSAGGAE